MSGFPWSAVASVGSSLIGGLFGQSAQNKSLDWQKKYARNRISYTVADAKKAGIHPLAALGSSAAGTMGSPIPGGSPMGDAIGDAGAAIGAHLSKREARAAESEERAARLDVLRSEASRNRASAQAMLADATSRTAIMQARAKAVDVPTTDVVGHPTVGVVATGKGQRLVADPDYSDAEVAQQRYGEVGEFAFGVRNLIADHIKKHGVWPGVLGY